MGYYEDLRKKQKETGEYQTRDGGIVKTTPKPTGGSGGNIVSGASSDLGAGLGTPTTSSSNNGSGSSGSKTTGGGGNKTTLNMTYSAPTVKAKPTVKAAIQAVDGSKIAAEAYKQKLAAARANQAYAYDDGYDESKNPNSGREKSGLNTSLFELFGGSVPTGKQADYSGLEAAKTYTPKPQAWRDAPLSGIIGNATPADANSVAMASADLDQRVQTTGGGGAFESGLPGGGLRTYGANDVSLMSANLDQNLAERAAREKVAGMAAEALANQNSAMTLTGQTLLDEAAFNAAVEAQKKQIADAQADYTNQNTYANQNAYARGLPAGFTMQPKDDFYSRERALWLLDKYGIAEADIGIPLEAMYEGDHRYILPYLLNKPDNDTLLSNGKLITVGELKNRLTNGAYVPNVGMTGTAQPAAYGASEIGGGEAGMDDSLQDILDAQQAQYDAQLQMLRNQKGVLNDQYDANAADLYAMYRRSGLMMPEMLAGTATGIADSMTLQNDLNFQNNLAANELERAAAQNELNAQASQIQADADLQAAQTAAEWAQMVYQQRQKEQNKGGNGGNGGNGDDDGYDINTIEEAQQYLELQLGMGNNMSRDNIISLLKDMYKAGAISKTLAQDTAAKFGIGLYL